MGIFNTTVVLDKETSERGIRFWLNNEYKPKLESDISKMANKELLATGIAIGLKTQHTDGYHKFSTVDIDLRRTGSGQDFVNTMHKIVIAAKKEVNYSDIANSILAGVGEQCYKEAEKIGKETQEIFDKKQSQIVADSYNLITNAQNLINRADERIKKADKRIEDGIDALADKIYVEAVKKVEERLTKEFGDRILKAVTKALVDPEIIKTIATGLREFQV